MAASFRPPHSDFKRLFEIHHFYVEGKANRKRPFDAAASGGGRCAQKSTPSADGGEALGVGGVGRKLASL
jgi:hypothetical protein